MIIDGNVAQVYVILSNNALLRTSGWVVNATHVDDTSDLSSCVTRAFFEAAVIVNRINEFCGEVGVSYLHFIVMALVLCLS